jgi:hypothetical protein
MKEEVKQLLTKLSEKLKDPFVEIRFLDDGSGECHTDGKELFAFEDEEQLIQELKNNID